MFYLEKNEVQRLAIAALGLLVICTTLIGSTVSPAHTAEIAPLAQTPSKIRA